MSKLHQTESGYISLGKSGKEVELCFNNFKLSLSMRALRQLNTHLKQIDPLSGMYTPNEKTFELCFSSAKFALTFDYYEIEEFEELVEEGLAAWELQHMLNKAGIQPPRDLIS